MMLPINSLELETRAPAGEAALACSEASGTLSGARIWTAKIQREASPAEPWLLPRPKGGLKNPCSVYYPVIVFAVPGVNYSLSRTNEQNGSHRLCAHVRDSHSLVFLTARADH
jgi:hypothetical protein